MNKDTYLGVERMFFEDPAVFATDNIFIAGISQLLKHQSLGDHQMITKMTHNLLEYLCVTMRTELERNPDSNLYNLDELECIDVMLCDYIRTENHIQHFREQCEQNEIKLDDLPLSVPAQEIEVTNGH